MTPVSSLLWYQTLLSSSFYSFLLCQVRHLLREQRLEDSYLSQQLGLSKGGVTVGPRKGDFFQQVSHLPLPFSEYLDRILLLEPRRSSRNQRRIRQGQLEEICIYILGIITISDKLIILLRYVGKYLIFITWSLNDDLRFILKVTINARECWCKFFLRFYYLCYVEK